MEELEANGADATDSTQVLLLIAFQILVTDSTLWALIPSPAKWRDKNSSHFKGAVRIKETETATFKGTTMA